MLAELKLSNFRLFDDEVTIRFRPITVLIGRNSSGKSSIIKFLLMLQQSVDPGRSQFLTAEGDRVRLGIFSELRNSLTRKRTLTFELATKSALNQVGEGISTHLGLPRDIGGGNLVYKSEARISYSKKISTGRAAYILADEASGRKLFEVGTKIFDDSSFGEYPYQRQAIEPLPEIDANEESLDRLAELWDQRYKRLLGHFAEIQLIDTIRYEIDSLRHLSPVRSESQRVVVASPPPVDSVGQGGEYSLAHLQRLTAEDRKTYEFILPYLERIAGIRRVDFRTSSGYLTQAFARNRDTEADVHIADYGFGVSQCIPIIVQGAIMSRYTSLIVEQPEAQLHPTAQLEMGSYFAHLWKDRNVGSVIETHSDNILLRLRSLIAEGRLDHQDVSVAYFTIDEGNGRMPTVKNLDIDEDGSMQAGLPMEFFGADVLEGLRLGGRR